MKEKSTIEMICSVGELASLFASGQNLQGFLVRVVNIIKRHMQADMCSVFLYNEKKGILTLEATAGLNQDLVGKLTLVPGEGLTGLALKELHPVRADRWRDNPSFKYIPDSGEDQYESFLAMPVVRGMNRVGVLTLQDKRASRFGRSDELALRAITSQLAVALENAQLLITKPEKQDDAHYTGSRLIRGTQVVEGFATGRAYQMEGPGDAERLIEACDECYSLTLEDFRAAIDRTGTQLEELQNRLEEELADVASLIFSAHLLMLRDEGFSGAMEALIQDGTPPSEAVVQITNNYIKIFAASDAPRMREKVLDIKDLGHRILENLRQNQEQNGDYSGQIVITRELLPSELLKLAAQNVEGFVLFGGGITAHVSVLARSLQVPLIYTEEDSIFRIPSNTELALDAHQGNLVVEPDDAVLKRIRQLADSAARIDSLTALSRPETRTQDGQQIHLRATVNLLSDIKLAKKLNAEGIGLYRSEFPFLIRNDFPTEEEQFKIYSQVTGSLDNPLVTLRTLDVGGDKILSYIPESEEANPFLGLRAIRFLLENQKIFIGQLKAMIRAGAGRRIRIMFPLISSVDDFINARNVVLKSMEYLERDGTGSFPMPQLGAMIELPSAVEMAPELAEEADFLSLGTNDLIQYTLGVDRTNEKVADLFDTRHPAVLRAVKRVSDAAQNAGCPLSVCGIMSRDPISVYYLIGLGIREFSLDPANIPAVQDAVSRMDSQKARQDAGCLSGMGTLAEIRDFTEQLKITDTENTPDVQDAAQYGAESLTT